MANRYWVNDDADGLWNVANNWSASSGGAGGAGVPGASDTAIFDSNDTADCRLDASMNITALTIVAGYTGKVNGATDNLDHDFSGALNVSAGEIDIGTGALTVGGVITINGGLLTIGTSAGTGLTTAGLTLLTASSIGLQDGSLVNNSGNFSAASTSMVNAYRGHYTQTASGTFVNVNGTNAWHAFTIDVGVTLTCTGTSVLTFITADGVTTINGTLALGANDAWIGSRAAGGCTIGASGDITGTGDLYNEFASGATLTNNRASAFSFTGTVWVYSIVNTNIIPAWDFSNSDIYLMRSSDPKTRNFSAGTLKCIDFIIGDDGAGTLTVNNLNNASLEISGEIDVALGGYTTVWTKGTGSIELTNTATKTVDFDGLTVEDIVKSGSGITEILSDFTTDSFSGTDGTLRSYIPAASRTITVGTVGIASDMTLKDISFGAKDRINAKDSCVNNGNNRGVIFRDRLNPLFENASLLRPFVIEVKTDNTGTSNNDQFTLPLESGETYNCIIDWGDGTETIQTTDVSPTHTYVGGAGTYNIGITGAFPQIVFNLAGDCQKLTDIKQWGSIVWGSMYTAFRGCTNLITISAIDTPDLSGCTNTSWMFENCSGLTSICCRCFDMSNITTIAYMFQNCTSIITIDIKAWDVSSVTTVEYLFKSCTNLTSIDLADWVTTSLTDVTQMFRSCTSMVTCDLSNWDVTGVSNTSNIFLTCTSMATLNLTGWDTSNISNMIQMFLNCNALDIDVSSFDITALTDATGMFQNSSFSTTNYDLLLVAWEGKTHNDNVPFHAGTAKYNAGAPATARDQLVLAVGSGGDGWTITDGGAV